MKKFRESFSAKLAVFTAMLASLVFLICYSIFFYSTHKAVKKEVEKMAMCQLDNTVLRVTNLLNSVEQSANDILTFVETHTDEPDLMFTFARLVVEKNPNITGCSIAFEPDHFSDKGYYFSAYAGREQDGTITVEQEGSESYNYLYMDWYQIPKLLKKPYWVDPYNDIYEDEVNGKIQIETICSYGSPIHDQEGNFIGVLSIDVSQNWMSKIIGELKPYPDSYTIALGRGGIYLVHPDSTVLGSHTIFTEYMATGNEELHTLGEQMVGCQRGMQSLKGDLSGRKDNCYVFFTPLEQIGWSVGLVCHESDIYSGLNSLKWMLIGMTIIGVFAMIVICIISIRKRVKPLEELAKSAYVMAKGNFDMEIPVIRGVDEVALLSKAFRNMQHSLVDYIDELKSTTAKKERIEGELHIAHDIQMGMIPKIFPPYPDRSDIDIYATLVPAKEVGGDLYDFLILDNKFYFCIGDVSGKGVPASLLMAVCRNLFRTMAGQGLQPSEIVTMINDTMGENNESGMFITLFVAMVDMSDGNMIFCNAGHNPPVIIDNDGKASYMNVLPNIPAGLFDGMPFEQQVYGTIDGLTLFLYTDGLTEAENIDQNQYGDDKLIEELTGRQDNKAQQLIEYISETVKVHAGEAEQSDDLTIMTIKINIKK